MMQTRPFRKTRTRLALWYALVMGFILSLCGFGVYEIMIYAHLVAIDRELESVTGTLHDSLEPNLKQPKVLEPIFKQILPDICLASSSCSNRKIYAQNNHSSNKRHIFSAIYQSNFYYIRFIDREGKLIALAGSHPEGLPVSGGQKSWQTLKDGRGDRYHQMSLPLHTQDNRLWGYMQVGRSLKDLDSRLAALQLFLGLGLPITVLLVGGSSWWLARLAMQPINESYQQMKQFTADAAHELRTPVAAIRAAIESVLRMPYLSEQEAQDTLKNVASQNHRLAEMIEELLLLAQLEQPKTLTQYIHCCLNDLAIDLVEEFADMAFAAKVTLTSQVRAGKLLYVLGDEDQLYRLVSNLIVNAIKYTPAGGQITVVLDRSNGHAEIEVRDTGIGIASEDRKQIFERFYRVNCDRSRNTGGSGLGLAIAAAIVQAHGGSIQVQSELGKGSTFTIRLPLDLPPPSNVRVAK
ncbi:two-component system sensor histidine kinase RppB [Microcoleus sp. F4-D5]|uniref:two-component system sensor histidine kinase RppB n=1 Tax=Microcoleus sp. F4-D5 TaxID=2818760 RepID=UPI002FCEB4EF